LVIRRQINSIIHIAAEDGTGKLKFFQHLALINSGSGIKMLAGREDTGQANRQQKKQHFPLVHS
jgi:hypothetical protein